MVSSLKGLVDISSLEGLQIMNSKLEGLVDQIMVSSLEDLFDQIMVSSLEGFFDQIMISG